MNIRKGWTQYEDESLAEVIDQIGTDNWTAVADLMISKYDIKDRSGKKCRERWINHLKPEVIKSPWSPEEMKILFRCQAFYGNQWTEIAKFLPGRTDNSVKNYFYMTLRKRLRLFNKHVSPAERIEMPINDLSLNSELTQKVLNVDSQKSEKRTENRRRSARLQENGKTHDFKGLPKVEHGIRGFCVIEELDTFTSLYDDGVSFDFAKYELDKRLDQGI